jgi:hypothetical protein
VFIFVHFNRPWVYALDISGSAEVARTTLTNYYLTNEMHWLLGCDPRVVLPIYSTHALRVADDAAYSEGGKPGRGVPFILTMLVALLVGYVVSGAASLYVEYNHSSTLDRERVSPLETYNIDQGLKYRVLTPTRTYSAGTPQDSHNRVMHFGIGVGITTVLSVLRLRFADFPLHPVGYLLAYSYTTEIVWFSVFVGWVVKVVIVRFGGARLFYAGRMFFIGLIVGEAGAAAVWMAIGVALHAMGYDFYSIHVLP